jgi:hypothetical protein
MAFRLPNKKNTISLHDNGTNADHGLNHRYLISGLAA